MIQNLTLTNNVIHLLEDAGGKVFYVGGWVRDSIMDRDSKDIDLLVCGLPLEAIPEILNQLGKANLVGDSFGVCNLRSGETSLDIAVPRKDKKVGEGHQGFEVEIGDHITLEDDLYRRDFTVNAIALDPDGKYIDPYKGEEDIKAKIIRALNPEVFVDDPLRLLRAIRFAAQLGFSIESATWDLIVKNATLIRQITGERIATELEKIYKSNPQLGTSLLIQSGLYKELVNKVPSHLAMGSYPTFGAYLYFLLGGLKTHVWGQSDFKEIEKYGRSRLLLKNEVINDMEAAHILFTSIASEIIEVNKVLARVKKLSSVPLTRYTENLSQILQITALLVEQDNIPLYITDLEINGDQLKLMGVEEGQKMGEILLNCLHAVWLKEVKNTHQSLKEYVNILINI